MSVPRRKKNKNILTGTLKAAGQDQPVHSLYVNKNLSWLEFNKRVLEQAFDESVPLLDRVRFLGIFQSNLDEFFMKKFTFKKIKSGFTKYLAINFIALVICMLVFIAAKSV